MATIFRQPLTTRIERIDPHRSVRSQSDIFRNIALMATVAATLAPSPKDWSVPRGPARTIDLVTLAQNPLTLRAPASTQPATNLHTNYQGRPFPTDLLTVTTNTIPLRNSGLGTPVLPVDLPNPTRSTASPALRNDSGRNLLILSTQLNPFKQTVWPNPQPVQRLNDGYSWTAGIRLPTTVDPEQPPATWTTLVPVASPWVAIGSQGGVVRSPVALIGQPAVAVRPIDWPNPRGPEYLSSLRTWSVSLQQSTLQPLEPTPFNQYNHPVPPGAAYPVALRTHAVARRFALDSFFGSPGQVPANLDWPVPKGYKPVVTSYTWTQNLLQTTLLPPPPPPGDTFPDTLSINSLRIGF